MQWIPWRFFIRSILDDLHFHEVVDELRDFDERFRLILRKHLAVLGWWCLINGVSALLGLFLLGGGWWYFVLMNASWAIINFLVVLWIYHHIIARQFADGNTYQRFEGQRHVEKMLLLNIGLDLAYIFAGLFLWTLGRVPDTLHVDLWRGFGASVVLQGTFLFIHDNVFYRLHRINFRKARAYLESVLHRDHKPMGMA